MTNNTNVSHVSVAHTDETKYHSFQGIARVEITATMPEGQRYLSLAKKGLNSSNPADFCLSQIFETDGISMPNMSANSLEYDNKALMLINFKHDNPSDEQNQALSKAKMASTVLQIDCGGGTRVVILEPFAPDADPESVISKLMPDCDSVHLLDFNLKIFLDTPPSKITNIDFSS